MGILKWLQDWSGVLGVLLGLLTLVATIVLTIIVYRLQHKFSITQKKRADIESIIVWATDILSLQNEYFITNELVEIYKKSEELSRRYIEISLITRGLSKTVYNMADNLNKEFDKFIRFLQGELIENRKETKEVPYSKEIQSAVLSLLQESINYRNTL